MLKMLSSGKIHYDVASAISLGQREFQEDAVIADFPLGSELGFAVLADGIGGHAAGDIASKIVVTEVFSELKLQTGDPKQMERDISKVLLDAAKTANDCVRAHSSAYPGTRGMGATLVAPVLMGDRLYWVSVGDSPLFLFRDGKLEQLNEDHSMAPQIDYLVRSGVMDSAVAMNHPDRNCLTSVLIGQHIPQIDCPKEPVVLIDGDILIVASDGLQFLDNDEIAELLADQAKGTSAEITSVLLRCLEELADPDQDNVSFCVIKVRKSAKAALAAPEVQESPRRVSSQRKKRKVTIMATASERGLAMMYRVSSEKTA